MRTHARTADSASVSTKQRRTGKHTPNHSPAWSWVLLSWCGGLLQAPPVRQDSSGSRPTSILNLENVKEFHFLNLQLQRSLVSLQCLQPKFSEQLLTAGYCLALGIRVKTQLCPQEFISYCGKQIKIKTQEKENTDQCDWRLPTQQQGARGGDKKARRGKKEEIMRVMGKQRPHSQI